MGAEFRSEEAQQALGPRVVERAQQPGYSLQGGDGTKNAHMAALGEEGGKVSGGQPGGRTAPAAAGVLCRCCRC